MIVVDRPHIQQKYNIFLHTLQAKNGRRRQGTGDARFRGSVDFGDVVGGSLIHVVIEPVGVKQLACAPPADNGRPGGVIVGKIVIGHMDGQPFVPIPEVFFGQRVRIVLGVPGDEELAGVLALHGENTGISGNGEQLQAGGRPDVALVDLGVPGMRGLEDVVESPEERGVGLQDPVVEHTEELFRQGALLDPVMEVEAGLGTPADMERGVDMGLGPLHDFAQLIPVVHLGEVQILHRSAGDDHTVIAPVTDLVKGGIKGGQMVLVGVVGLIAGGAQQLHRHLKRGVGELAQDLGFGYDLRGHQVQNEHIQWTDVLVHGPVFCHDEDILAFQRRTGGKGVWDLDGHRWDLPVLQWESQIAMGKGFQIYK